MNPVSWEQDARARYEARELSDAIESGGSSLTFKST